MNTKRLKTSDQKDKKKTNVLESKTIMLFQFKSDRVVSHPALTMYMSLRQWSG